MTVLLKATLVATIFAATSAYVAPTTAAASTPPQSDAVGHAPTSNDAASDYSDTDANLIRAHAEVAAARANIMDIFKEACHSSREDYLQIYEMSSDRDRALLKETCAKRRPVARRKR